MESLQRQVRILQLSVLLLIAVICLLVVNAVHPLLNHQRFGVIDAGRINIREGDGTLKLVLSKIAGLTEGDRSRGDKPRFSGMLFYNEEGQETGGLIYQGKAITGGQDSDVTFTMDQYRQDQNVYLNHSEHKDARGSEIADGLYINSRPDWTGIKTELAIDKQLDKLNGDALADAKLAALRDGSISARRLFYGVRRGTDQGQAFDDAGLFIRNRWGRDAIKLYVDADNKPHFQVFDSLGKTKVYELQLQAKAVP